MTNVFDDKATPPVVTPSVDVDAPTPTPVNDLLSGIKDAEGKQKYATTDIALKALNDSQDFITTLKAENAKYKAANEKQEEELRTQKTVDDVLERLQKPNTPDEVTPSPSGLTQEDVNKLIAQSLNNSKAQDVSATNVEQVSEKLVLKYGDKAQEAMLAAAKANGYSPEEFRALAGTKPQAVLNLLGVTNNLGSRQSTPSSYNISPVDRKLESPKPAKNMLVGASDKERGDYIKEIREYVHQEMGVTE